MKKEQEYYEIYLEATGQTKDQLSLEQFIERRKRWQPVGEVKTK